MILSIRSSFKKLLVLQRDYLMVLGEKHGTNYLPYTKYMCREEKFMLYIILLAELYGHMSKTLLTYAFYRTII